jgi:flagellar L-ring protein precursor FlgH
MTRLASLARTALGLSLGAASLTGCNMLERMATVGSPPPMTQVQNPVHSPTYQRVSMPMPEPAPQVRQANSLWRTGARAFFKDQRANQIGDILTVMIEISDKAELSNTTSRSRANTEDASIGAFLGYETSLSRILPETINPGSLVDLDSQSSNTGAGSIDREESIELKVAAVITQKLPNGNLVLIGRQEVRVNFEVRQLQIAGVIRPEDITAQNTVSYEKIAEARISYGGVGHITDVQQPRYGQQIYDIVWPF